MADRGDAGADLWARFADPPRRFWPTPLWWWSGDRVEAPRLRWQLERLAAGGARNVVIMNVAPTSPLYGKQADDPAFLSDGWWELLDGVCRDAQELGVSVWFYDQIGFSGANFQGIVVRDHPEHAGLALERVFADGDGPLRVRCPAGGTPLAAAALPLDGGPPVPLRPDGGEVAWSGRGRHRLMLFYTVERGFDYFAPQACERLLALVHGRIEARAGHWLGSVIVGSFQDELPAMPTWSRSFADEFARRAGYDPLPRLAGLWEDLGESSEHLRRDFHAVRGALAEEALFIPLSRWHDRFGLSCGFDQQWGARSGDPVASTRLYGDYLRTHRWLNVPGSDHHGEAKVHSSMAHAYGHERTWIESFHSSGWGGTPEETFDWLLPWLGAGANLYNPHATYYSTRRGWWEWAPPATDWRQPYWRHNAVFARAVARLCSALTCGRHACDVAVLAPTTTAQAGLGLDGPTAAARAAEETYRRIVGQMAWYAPRPGVLNDLRRDFDVLDDPTVAAGVVGDGTLEHHGEAYRAIVLAGCVLLEADTARRLVEFVDAGGTLVAVGAPPARVAGDRADQAPLVALRERFARGAAASVATPEELGGALAAVVPGVRADVPTLMRRDGERTVVFVPAAFPRVTRTGKDPDTDLSSLNLPDVDLDWVSLRYEFDAHAYARAREVTVAGVSGAPELWEPFSGARRRLDAVETAGGVTVRVPFDDGPAALLVWGAGDAPAPAEPRPHREILLEGAWDVTVERTLEDDWGDLDAPGADVETWALTDADGAAVHATFGARGAWLAPGADGWQPAVWSPTRGIRKDPLHLATLGPSGHVPEEFLRFGRVRAGEAVRFRTVVEAAAPLATHLAVGAAASKQAWLDGQPVALDGAGYLALGPVTLPDRPVVLELRLEACADTDLRAHFAFVADAEGYRRPEWLRAAGAGSRDAVVAFSMAVELPADAVAASVLVGANGPCRVLLDGVEVGRQGGFDPYLERDVRRLQPYELTSHLGAGAHELRLELLDLGRVPPVALADGLIETRAGTVPLRSSEGCTATRDGVDVPLELELVQEGDPAYAHAWRRPHPLPGGAWLDPGGATADPGGRVEVRAEGEPATVRLSLTTPPGATRLRVPLAGGCALRAVVLEGEQPAVGGASVELPAGARAPRRCELVVDAAPGLSGGGVLAGPVAFEVGPGTMELGDWQERGLPGHSGAVRYRRALPADLDADASVMLDLGAVRGTAEVLVDGEPVGVRVCSPYVFDLGDRARPGAALEILVCNTLAPHLDAVSPTHYVFAGQKRSGLFGPVTLRVAAAG